MSKRHNYEMYIDVLDKTVLLNNTLLLLRDYEQYFQKYKKKDEVDWGVFYTHFSQDWHSKDLDLHDVEYYRDYVFTAIAKADGEEVQQCLMSLTDKAYKEKIRNAIANELNIEELNKISHEYEAHKAMIAGESVIEEKDGYNIKTVDFSVLDKSQGIPWFLPTLQNNLGSLVKGQFAVIAADKGTGKSAFVISELVHAFKYLHKIKDERPILYFNSEGTEADVLTRFLSNIYRKKYTDGFEEIVENQQKVNETLLSDYKDYAEKLWVFPIANVHNFDKVKKKIDKYNPALVIIDICDKLALDEDAMSLKKLYDNLRVLSAAVCPIIGTSQAGDQEFFDKNTNELKTRKWLTANATYGSKQKGGAADTMIMIGKDDVDANIRYVSVTKKKRGKEVKITCTLTDKFSRYQELDW